jgi:pilus assembly protein Flp/PilA
MAMNKFSFVKALVRKQEGATAVEYGLIAGLIAVAIVVAVAAIGTNLDLTFDKIVTCLTTRTCS